MTELVLELTPELYERLELRAKQVNKSAQVVAQEWLVERLSGPPPALPDERERAVEALLSKIEQTLPLDVQNRYTELIAKREAEILASVEHQELLSLIDQIEILETKQVEYLAELAHLRKTSLEALIGELGLSFHTDAPAAYMDTYRVGGVTETINRVYKKESSTIDPVLMQLQAVSLEDENW